MFIWTNSGWLGIVLSIVPLAAATFLSRQYQQERWIIYIVAWVTNCALCWIVGRVLNRDWPAKLQFALPPEERAKCHTLNGLRLEWTWLLTLPVYIIFYFVVK
jgi:hypothetical protein